MPDRPNILLVITDQQTAFAMSCMGNRDIKTPAMDGLAERGTLFELAYCAQPLCTPSRASMFTGMMPHECGVTKNRLGIPEELRSQELGHVMARAGYDCAYGGKWHVPEVPMVEGHGFRIYSDFGDDDLAERCVSFLNEPHEKPFFCVAGFDNPHNICEYGRSQSLPWGNLPSPPPPEECPNLPPNFAIPPFEPEIIRVEQACDFAKNPGLNWTGEDWRRHRWGYNRIVEKGDAAIGRIFDALRETGLEENTLVIITSDHGDGYAAHQWTQKSVMYEEPMRVPMIIACPGGQRGVNDREHLVNTGLDIFPTICDFAGAEVPKGLRGGSLRGLVEDQSATLWREALFAETKFDGNRGYATEGRMVRTLRYKYVIYDKGKYREQLFDMQADPGEMVNLAVEARFAEVLADHRQRLLGFFEETNDPFPSRGLPISET
jgi:arylsulfatase A-like enzyme